MPNRIEALASTTIEKIGSIDKVMDKMGHDKHDAIKGLLELHQITPDNLADYVGDFQAAKMLIGDLVKVRCIARVEKGKWYLKNPSFSRWLRSKAK